MQDRHHAAGRTAGVHGVELPRHLVERRPVGRVLGARQHAAHALPRGVVAGVGRHHHGALRARGGQLPEGAVDPRQVGVLRARRRELERQVDAGQLERGGAQTRGDGGRVRAEVALRPELDARVPRVADGGEHVVRRRRAVEPVGELEDAEADRGAGDPWLHRGGRRQRPSRTPARRMSSAVAV